jgi:hypothetical protein
LIFGATTFSKSGGGGNTPSPYTTTSGYYNLTSSYATWFKQLSTGSSASYYANNYIQLDVKSNGVQGANSDVGSVITFKSSFIDAATDSTYPELAGNPDYVDEVHGTLRVSITVRPPESTYLTTASWGTPTVASVSSTGSGTSSASTALTRSFVNNYTTSPWNLDVNGAFNIGVSAFNYIQPSFDFKAWVYMWGAGGGGGTSNNGYYPAGGPGGFTYGLVQFKTGYTYYIRVGEGGYSNGGGGAYPGGYGGRGIGEGAGGGLTGLYLNTDGFGSMIMVAGGGGGGGNAYTMSGSGGYWGGGGGGGGSSGQSSGVWPFGRTPSGGSQVGVGLTSTGGSGAYNGGWNGYNFWGGAGGDARGGGGGGGYYGGGGGGWNSSWYCPGAGGSGYINATHVSSGQTFTSSGGGYSGFDAFRSPQGLGNSYWGNAGAGGYQSSAGSAGRIVIL